MSAPADHDARRLRQFGATEAILPELQQYCENPFDRERLTGQAWPLQDEAHIAAWMEYTSDAKAMGVLPALAKRFPQLCFKVEAGISQDERYRAATRRGVWPSEPGRIALVAPEALALTLHSSLAGRIPILVTGARADFETLVRAFTCRNEPEAVPASMGACIVAGFNNWDRVAAQRLRFESETGCAGDEDAWQAEFKRLIPQKELYQDRFIILSRGPYSAVSAAAAGLGEDEWLERSLTIRREHECTHYITLRLLGRMRNNLLDEVIADCAGLLAAFGRYDERLALTLLGLEDYPRLREGGRFGNYLGQPPLSAPAVEVLKQIVWRAVQNIARACARQSVMDSASIQRIVLGLTARSLPELASDEP